MPSPVFFLTIQFSMSHLYTLSLNVKQFYLTHRSDPIKCYHFGSEWTWERWQWRSTSHSPKLQHSWSLTIRLFSVKSRTLVVGILPKTPHWGGILPLCKGWSGIYKESNQVHELAKRCHHLVKWHGCCYSKTRISDLFQAIQLNISHLFAHSLNVKQFYLTNR